MSIASELTNLENNIGDAYDAVDDMSGIIPQHKNMDNLDQAIRTIPQSTFSPLDAYPVGAIYMSVNNTDPGTLFGGTWVAWGTGRVPVGIDTNDTDFDTVEETGGEKSHTLTTTELPNINGSVAIRGNADSAMSAGTSSASGVFSMTSYWSNAYTLAATNTLSPAYSGITLDVGGGQSHNNLQPYITCYMWKRTA